MTGTLGRPGPFSANRQGHSSDHQQDRQVN